VKHRHPPALGIDQSRTTQLGEVVTHRGFTKTDREGEVAAAFLPLGAAEQQRHQLDPNRIGQRLEAQRNLERGVIVDWTRSDRGATHRPGDVDRWQCFGHAVIMPWVLTYIEEVGIIDPKEFDISHTGRS
jgi:hypothetical protein